MDNNYKFINLVDPSKCRAKVKDKFAKLTLSSNKKKQEESEMAEDTHDKVVSRRISRNLLSELFTDDESDKDEQIMTSHGNLLMRTDSSSSLDIPKRLDATDATHCSQIENEPEKSLEMEPLIVSCLDYSEQLDQEIGKLSSRISSLAVVAPPASTIRSEDGLQDVSRIISMESQRMASGQICSPIKLRAEVKREPDVSICISSSDDDLKEESDLPITISDSSEGEGEAESEPIQDCRQDQEQEDEPNVSSIVVAPSSSQNMSVVKANQMAAFLRDVRKNYGVQISSPNEEFERRRREIATADTEPMTTENDSRSIGTARRIATADTESMTMATEKDPSPDTNRKLAFDDTEDMTKLDESLYSFRHYNPVVKVGQEVLDVSVHRASDSIPDDSLTIAETSEEEDDEREHTKPHETPPQKDPQSNGTSSALRKSESCSQAQSTNSSMSSGDNQVQINISAKINIKIQVSQQMEGSSCSEMSDSFQSNEKSTNQSIGEQQQHSSAHKGSNNHTKAFEEIPHSPPTRDVPEEAAPSGDFMDKAQQLLNELYGDQWMTPQVLRSLRKVTINSTSRTAPRSSESGKNSKERKETPASTDNESVKMKSKEPMPRPQAGKVEETSKSNVDPTDESVLADFSIFRRNIPQDLDSTRLPMTPISKFKAPQQISSISKAFTSQKPKPKTLDVTKTRSGREVRQQWRNIVDNDTESEGENASSGEGSDASWKKSDDSCEIENEESPTNRRKKTTRSGRPARQTQRDIRNDVGFEPENTSPDTGRNKRPPTRRGRKNHDEIVYLDLTKDEVEIHNNVSASPPANNDAGFNTRLENILRTCRYEDKPKLTTPGSKSKRKLFSALADDELENIVPEFESPRGRNPNVNIDEQSVSISGARMPAKFEPFNKYLESVKTGKPIFKIQTPKTKQNHRDDDKLTETPRTVKKDSGSIREIGDISKTPRDKYGFLKSLDVCVGKSNCHPDALYYRDNFRVKKEELATKLYEIYNEKCFDNKLNVPLVWNKKLTNTAGRCMNKKRLGERTCVIELSEKVLTSADRLRCTLIHELCHAVTWIVNGEGGHGATWKAWARKANHIFPELPKIGVCHQYDIEYKYTYKCVLCGAKSHAHSKSKKVENIRCSYCHGAIEVYLNKKDKEGNNMLTPIKEPTGFAKFVKEKYKDFKRPDLKHADVMKLLSNEFASMKVDGGKW